MIFGPLGDRIGRAKVLSLTIILLALATFSIGLIPSYNSIGVAAPMLVLLAKMAQGLSTGGEYGGAMTFIAEYAPYRRRGFLGSWLEFGSFAGYLIGVSMVAVLKAALTIAFRFCVYLRRRLDETPAFEKVLATSEQHKGNAVPTEFRGIFVRHWRAIVLCGGMVEFRHG